MRRNSFTDLNAFVAVAEHRNFTKAATQLGISPSTLSQTIRMLEERFGVRLLNRTTRSVAPTEAGERLLIRLQPVLSEFDAVLDSVNAFRDRPVGNLRLAMSAIANRVMAPTLSRFMAKYPEIHVDLVVSTRRIDIVAERFDAGIRIGRKLERDMIAVRASQDIRYAVAGSPAYLSQRTAPQSPRELQDHNCVRFRYTSGLMLPWLFEIEGKTAEVEVGGSLIANDPEAAICAVRNNIGLFYGPLDCMKHAIDDGDLVCVLDEFIPAPTDGFFLYYPSRRQNPATLQALIDFLHKSLSGRGLREGGPRPHQAFGPPTLVASK